MQSGDIVIGVFSGTFGDDEEIEMILKIGAAPGKSWITGMLTDLR